MSKTQRQYVRELVHVIRKACGTPRRRWRCQTRPALLSIGCGLLLLASGTSMAEAMTIHVSAAAAVGGDGSAGKPFQSLTEARDAIRSRRKSGLVKKSETVEVLVGAGVYPLQASFELTAADSGSADAPVVYRAEQGGEAKMLGGVALKASSFKPVSNSAVLSRLDRKVRGKVRMCDLSNAVSGTFSELRTAFRGAPTGPWLYVNQQPMTLARWPNVDAANSGWAGFSKAVDTGNPDPKATDAALRKPHPGSFVFDNPRPARWNLSEGVWLMGYWTHDWNSEVIRVASYDKARKVIKLAAPHSYGINAGTWGAKQRRFFAMNALEELDAPGEWYLDRARKQLYLYPESDLRSAEIVLATLTEPLVKLNAAKHVKLIGLTFACGHGDGIIAQNTEQVEIAGCTVANLAGSAMSISGSGNVIRSCDLFNLGKAGVSLNGGDRKSLTPAKNLAVNNHIHHYGIFQRTYAAGIHANGCGQIVRNNCIHDAPHNAILYGGNEHLLEGNEVYRVVMETGDAGAFYTGRDWTSRGNVLRNNFVHDLGGGEAGHVNTMGFYFDDCDCGDTIEGNVFYRAGRAIMIGGGRDNPVLNNLVIDCPIGLHIDSRGMSWKQWNNPAYGGWNLEEKAEQMNYKQPPWSTKYPRLAAIFAEEPREPLGNPVCRNVFINCSKQVLSFDRNVMSLLDKFEIKDNWVLNTTGTAEHMAKPVDIKGFKNLSGTKAKPLDVPTDDVTKPEFAARWNAWAQKNLPSVEPIPFEKIGLYQDEYRRVVR